MMYPTLVLLGLLSLATAVQGAIPDPIVEETTDGAKLARAYIADEHTIVLHILDGKVERIDDGKTGEHPYSGHESKGQDKITRHTPPLNVDAVAPERFTVRGPDGAEMTPTAVHRKSKVNGVAWGWPEGVPTMEHELFLTLPEAIKGGDVTYTVELDPALSIDAESVDVRMHPDTPTEAIHVNLVGYDVAATTKSADLYLWRGDGGGRDYSDVEGNAVWLYEPETQDRLNLNTTVKKGQPRQKEFGGWDLTGSDVWTCDLGDIAGAGTGTFQLFIEGVGFSRPFEIKENAAREPLRQSLIGFYYMRVGEPMADGTAMFNDQMPPPRQPRYLPRGNDAGEPADPEGFKVYLTTMGPDHKDWKTLGGDPWDNKDWSQWKLDGEPTNPNAYGGYADAADWDRRTPSLNIPLDLMLPYVLLGDKLNADDLDIRESGNGSPDLLDSAAYAVDYFRRLRGPDGGFSYGINNPTPEENVAYQADTAPWMAHANAAMNAMLADCYRIAGDSDRMNDYLATAKEAYAIGGDGDLDKTHDIGNTAATGADLKAIAAVYLYKVTGEQKYEDDFAELVRAGGDIIRKGEPDQPDGTNTSDRSNQLFAYAGYLSAAAEGEREIRHKELLSKMRADVVSNADRKHLAQSERFPSRRSADTEYGWFQTVIEVGPLMLAHHETGEQTYLDALLLESDYSLGRNPLNRVLMTGDPFFSDRHIAEAYTSGRNDGFPGAHPGQTPYMNEAEWGNNFMSDPGWMSSKGYPDWEGNWPQGEAMWNHWYNFSNNEFTPQQTMAGKTALYAYLHGVLQ